MYLVMQGNNLSLKSCSIHIFFKKDKTSYILEQREYMVVYNIGVGL
jgi:hypothetical protein